MSEFDAATAVHRVAEGRYRADLDPGFAFGGVINGGYLMALLTKAAHDASPFPHPISTATTFLRAGRGGPAEITVETLRAGRSVATLRLAVVQEGRTLLDATMTTGTLTAGAAAGWAGAAPAMPALDECSTPARRPGGDSFADRVELRFDTSTLGWLDGRPIGRPEMRGWFRLPGHEPDAAVLALAVDALPPVVLNLGVKGWAPTVELTWHMRGVPAPGWLAMHAGGRLFSDGWFDEEVEIWDSAGRLVAQSRQIARAGRG
ncbi:thioesterase family protein [Actinomadura craniellae]|uniref:Thioesterase family protein n=1 Tax=Actinomadura craniellae TaxID=2231787 RepID=A0A365H9H9_9ACTN|nr:thioesterase family protein [Actinomadura craniellae]RAY15800.1 thioesterase family protein [Actinomadura craniellae]